MHSLAAVIFYWQSNCNDGSGVPSMVDDPESPSPQDHCIEIRTILGGLDISDTSSDQGVNLVVHTPQAVEWTLMDPGQSRSGHLHGCFDLQLGSGNQQPLLQWHLEGNGATVPHQLQGIVDSFIHPMMIRGQGENSQHHIGQHYNDSIHQPLWQDMVTRIDEASDVNMELVRPNQDQNLNNIHTISLQPH